MTLFNDTAPSDSGSPSHPPAFSTPQIAADLIPDTGQLLVIVDKDGTLDPKVEDRDNARVPQKVVADLLRLNQLPDVTVAVVSGRSVASLKALVGEFPIRYYGLHGAESGRGDALELERDLPAELAEWVGAFSTAFREALVKAGILDEKHKAICEAKDGKAFGAHWRPCPELRDKILRAFEATWEAFDHKDQFELQLGDHVIELKPPFQKGIAVEELSKAFPPSHILTIGDDHTDLSMMEKARQLGSNSTNVIVENRDLHVEGALYVQSPNEVAEILKLVANKREAAL